MKRTTALLLALVMAALLVSCGGKSASTRTASSSSKASSSSSSKASSSSSKASSSSSKASSSSSSKSSSSSAPVSAPLGKVSGSGETDAGYKAEVTVTYYTPIKATGSGIPHPADTSVIIPAESVSGNARNTYIMPVTIQLKNATSGFDARADADITAYFSKAIIASSSKNFGRDQKIDTQALSDFNVKLYYYIGSKSSWTSASESNLSNNGTTFDGGVKWDTLKGGNTGRVLVYVVLKDVYTPKYPNGLPYYLWAEFGMTVGAKLDGHQVMKSAKDALFLRGLVEKAAGGGSDQGVFVVFDRDAEKDKLAALADANLAALQSAGLVSKKG